MSKFTNYKYKKIKETRFRYRWDPYNISLWRNWKLSKNIVKKKLKQFYYNRYDLPLGSFYKKLVLINKKKYYLNKFFFNLKKIKIWKKKNLLFKKRYIFLLFFSYNLNYFWKIKNNLKFWIKYKKLIKYKWNQWNIIWKKFLKKKKIKFFAVIEGGVGKEKKKIKEKEKGIKKWQTIQQKNKYLYYRKNYNKYKFKAKDHKIYKLLRYHLLFLDFWTVLHPRKKKRGPRRSKKVLNQLVFLEKDLYRNDILNMTWIYFKQYKKNYYYWISNINLLLSNIIIQSNFCKNFYFYRVILKKNFILVNKSSNLNIKTSLIKWDFFTISNNMRWLFYKFLYTRFYSTLFIKYYIKNKKLQNFYFFKKYQYMFIYLNYPTYLEINYRLFLGILIKNSSNQKELNYPLLMTTGHNMIAKRLRKYQ